MSQPLAAFQNRNDFTVKFLNVTCEGIFHFLVIHFLFQYELPINMIILYSISKYITVCRFICNENNIDMTLFK